MNNSRYNNNFNDNQYEQIDNVLPYSNNKKKLIRSTSFNSPNIYKNDQYIDYNMNSGPIKRRARRLKLLNNPITPIQLNKENNNQSDSSVNNNHNYSNNVQINGENSKSHLLPLIDLSYKNKTPTKAQVLFHKVNIIEDKMDYVVNQARKMEVLHEMFHKINRMPYDNGADSVYNSNRNNSMKKPLFSNCHMNNNMNYEENQLPQLKRSDHSVMKKPHKRHHQIYSNTSDMDDLNYQLRNLREEIRGRLLRMEVNQQMNVNNIDRTLDLSSFKKEDTFADRISRYNPNRYLY